MNKLKLGKKKILGFVTAGAIVVTMAGSYAAWDQLTKTTDATLTLDKPVVTTLSMDSFQPEERTLGVINKYTDTTTYVTENIPDDTTVKVDIIPTIKTKDGNTDLTSYFDITIKNGSDELDLSSGTATDTKVAKNGTTSYTVTVTPKAEADGEANSAIMDIAKSADPQVSVILESKLTAVTAP